MEHRLPTLSSVGRTMPFLLILVLTIVVAEAQAQSPSSSNYPWEPTGSTCAGPGARNSVACASANWPSWNETVQRVKLLYESEQFALLDRAMHELATSGRRFPSGDSEASAAYWAFRQLMPGPGTDARHQEKISRWRDAHPTSHFAVFAQARFHYGNAWSVRGSGTGTSVSRESWELFGIHLQKAESALMEAPKQLVDTPLWHNLMLAIAQDNPQSRSRPDDILGTAVKRWPWYYEFYEVRLTRLVPKWGGSWEHVESFIDKWSKAMARTEGDSLYARLYISVKNQGVTPEQTLMQWPRMKRSLDELIVRYPSATFKNLYASYACFARDHGAFGAALKQMQPGDLQPKAWIHGHSYEGCMRWAGI